MTGATGFIGAAVARALAGGGWRTKVLTRASSSLDRLGATTAERVEGSLEDEAALRRLVSGVEAIVHCAGAVRGASRADFDRVNVEGLGRLLMAAAEQHPPPRFLALSSLAARQPGLSHYAASKREGERVLSSASGGVSWTVLRPPAVYGPGDRELMPLFLWMRRGLAFIPGVAHARFSLLFVDDLASAVLEWLNRGGGERAVLDLHDGKPGGYRWQDLIDIVARLRGRSPTRLRIPATGLRVAGLAGLVAARIGGYPPMLTPGKVRELTHPDWVCDNQRISLELGWSPRVQLESGLRHTLEWPGSARI